MIFLPYLPYKTYCGRKAINTIAFRALVKTAEGTLGAGSEYMLVQGYSWSRGNYILPPD